MPALLRTASVCAWRNRASAWRTSGYLLPRIAAARSAALAAPDAPMASVPTGTPRGIWTIESSESSPRSIWLSTGTPSTGSVVIAAIIPGRWAAPPAPAITTSSRGLLPRGHSGKVARESGARRQFLIRAEFQAR